jgi:NNP family nitrate/nitrite transporter-like MFS transporter
MPAIYDSLVYDRHLTPHQAWRVAFIVPFILITATAIGMLAFCDDTPTGKWADRYVAVPGTSATAIVDFPGSVTDKVVNVSESLEKSDEKLDRKTAAGDSDTEAEVEQVDGELLTIARGEIVLTPTFSEAIRVIFSLQSLTLTMTYFCSFGGELAINSILGAYYLKNFPDLTQTGSGRWAAMFGLLNVFTRPAGGFIGDIIYKYTHSLWAKKFWIHFVGVTTGIFLIAIGITDPHYKPTLFGLVAGMAFFHEAGNGANFALVPHVHPFANGKSASVSSLPTKTTLANILYYERHCLWPHRRGRQPRWHHLRYHLPLQRDSLRTGVLDRRHHAHCDELECRMDSTHPEGSDWWEMIFSFYLFFNF